MTRASGKSTDCAGPLGTGSWSASRGTPALHSARGTLLRQTILSEGPSPDLLSCRTPAGMGDVQVTAEPPSPSVV